MIGAARWAGLSLWLGLVLAGCGSDESQPVLSEPVAATPPSGPYLKVLGTVQDGGLPHAGCTGTRGPAAQRDPDLRRHVASLALVLPTGGEVYLFDATPDLREQLHMLVDSDTGTLGKVDRHPVDGVFLTHAHIGHYLGLAFFGYEAIHSTRMPVFSSPRMAEFLRLNGPWSQLVELENIELVELDLDVPRPLGDGVSVTAVRAPHRDEYADTLGFIVAGAARRVLYLPDTDSWVAWETPFLELAAQIDVAVVDGTFYSTDELPGRRVEEIGHPLITTSMDLLQDLVDTGGIEVYFTHLNHSNPALDHDSLARRTLESRGFYVLEEGQRIAL